MNELNIHKRSLRTELRGRLTAVSAERLRAGSKAAAERLAATEEFRAARAIMIFLPLRYEIDARALALRAWQEDKTVTVPLVGNGQRHMIPLIVRSLEEPMDADHYGVSTPRAGEPFPIEMLDLVVVPGLGFDREGGRIGRGGGFYDRFLAQPYFRATTCGLAIAEQVVGRVPTEPHDVPLDMLVTDTHLFRFATAGMMRK